MAAAYGAGSNSSVVAGVNSVTFDSPNVAGTDKDGVVMVYSRDATTLADVDASGVTWNGVAMTLGERFTYDNAAYLGVSIWYIINPPDGVSSIVATWTGTIDTGGASSAYATGAAQSTPVDITGEARNDAAAGADPTVNLILGTEGCIIFDAFYHKDGNNLTVGANQTQIGQLGVNGGGDRAGASYELAATSGAKTMSWAANPDDDWVMVAVAIKQASVAAASKGDDWPTFQSRGFRSWRY